MKIEGLIWFDEIIEKIIRKHNVYQNEVRDIFTSKPYFSFVEKGHHKGDNVYAAMGQSKRGRYLIVFFIYKKNRRAIVLSARDMTQSERRRYEQR